MSTKPGARLVLSSGQSRYVLQKLLDEKRISQSDIRRCLDQLSAELQSLEHRLRVLKGADMSDHRGPNGTSPINAGRRLRLSPQRRARLKKQGLYLALMRQVPKTKRSEFKQLLRTQGIDGALAAMKAAVEAR